MRSMHDAYMQLAIEEAKKGWGRTMPNPLVGAVIVKSGQVLATGYHHAYGQAHAEVDAMQKLSPAQLKGATIYVTLEPCCHQGNTPPCSDAIIRAGLDQVVFANEDPDSRVRHRSQQLLREAGVKVTGGVLAEEARCLNPFYFYQRQQNRPYIVLKAALTLDGKIATRSHDSQWISCETARHRVHQLRAGMQTICVGAQTLRQDQPRLNCRLPGYEDKLLHKLIFSQQESHYSARDFAGPQAKVWTVNRQITASAQSFLEFCRQENIQSILVEGGGEVYTWFIIQQLANRILLFYKPAYLGTDGIAMYRGQGTDRIHDLENYQLQAVEQIEDNIYVDLAQGPVLPLLPDWVQWKSTATD